MGETAEDPCDPGGGFACIPPEQEHETIADYPAPGRRFAKLDVERLNTDWIGAVRSWLAHKHRTKKQMMDDLAAELRLRGNHLTALLNKSWPITPLKGTGGGERKL
jgi:hypothetical protein